VVVAIVKEARADETRVALTPDAVKTLTGKGFQIAVETGAGLQAGASDADYQAAGASISTQRGELLASADILPVVNALPAADQEKLKSGSVMIGFLRPLEEPAALAAAPVAELWAWARADWATNRLSQRLTLPLEG